MNGPEAPIPVQETEPEGQLKEALLIIAESSNDVLKGYLTRMDEWREQKGVHSFSDFTPKRFLYSLGEAFGSGLGFIYVTAAGLEIVTRKIEEKLREESD